MPLTLLSTAIGAGASAGTTYASQKKQYKYDKLSRSENYLYNEMAARNADARQRAQWRDMYSITAQMKQLKEAGLSPSLMYGGTPSQGGATAPQGNGASGPMNTVFPYSAIEGAQIAKLMAETMQIKKEMDKTEQETVSLEIQNYVDMNSVETSIETRQKQLQLIVAETEKLISDKKFTDWQTHFNEVTEQEQIKQLQHQNSNLLKDIAVKDSQIKLNAQQEKTLSAQIDKWQMDVTQKYYELDIASESQEAQEQWFKDQAENLVDKLTLESEKFGFDQEAFKKKLKVEKTAIWVGAVTDVIKAGIGAVGLGISAAMKGKK